MPLMVIKKDETREPFSRDKLVERILRACHKRPVSVSDIEKIADEIENTALNSFDKEITSMDIGEMVMQKLRDIDDVAYVRFASIYRQFKDINTFLAELEKMIQSEKKD